MSPELDLDALGSHDAPRGQRTLDLDVDPVTALGALRGERHAFLLDSADTSHADGRFAILGCNPWALLRARDGRGRLITDAGEHDLGDPLQALARVERSLHVNAPIPQGLPFGGGAVGYLGYDLGRFIERLPDDTTDDLGMDDLCLGLHDWALVRDHAQQTWHLVATARQPHRRSLDRVLDEAEALVRDRLAEAPTLDAPVALDPVVATRAFAPPDYVAAVARAIEHIYAGDIYQVNLSQRFAVPARATPFDLYRRLRQRTHAIFSAYLDTPSAHVLSLSPERFVAVRGRNILTCPIKGTRPRGATATEDAALAAELTASAKDRAELSMIVDLERNDLGRVCEAGTVRVVEHAALYTLATVHHTVTRVVGRLRPEVDTATLLRATFPGGSITGAPKIRAMEIIEDLEPTRRGVYTGSVGYLDYGGDLDLNIAIRTVPVINGTAYVQAGGGIVADSDPEDEYEETLTKARALIEGLGATLE